MLTVSRLTTVLFINNFCHVTLIQNIRLGKFEND